MNAIELKDFIEKCKKIHIKLDQIQDYQPPKELLEEKLDEDIIPPEEFSQLITYLKQQHDYLFEMEQSYQIYINLVTSIESFMNFQYRETRKEGKFEDKSRP